MIRLEERIYTIPLKKAYRAPRTKRANKAITIIKEFLKRHMKVKEVVIGESINHAVWKRGIQKPPRRIRVHAAVHEGKVYAELLGVDFKFPERKEGKKETDKEKQSKEVQAEKEHASAEKSSEGFC